VLCVGGPDHLAIRPSADRCALHRKTQLAAFLDPRHTDAGRESLDSPLVAVIPIDDPADPRIRVFRGLRDHQLRMFRERTDAELSPMCIVEGDRLMQRALAAGLELVSILRDPDRPEPIESELPEHVPVYTAAPDVAVELVGMHITRWAMSCFRRPRELSFEEAVGPTARRILATDRVINPTNLGAMVRAAAGLGMDAMIIDDESCDPLYRRASRVSMGASFTLPWCRVAVLPAALDDLRDRGYSIVAVELTASSVDLDLLPSLDRVVLVMGNEGYGLTPDVIERADHVARIPMHGGVDSLNVTAAAAVACWEITRRRDA
jgi:tRNA G18 (ribose-2'-O)-methylase SpoU